MLYALGFVPPTDLIDGGLLAAVALMARGADADASRPTPGFPDDGSWTVRHEGLHPMP